MKTRTIELHYDLISPFAHVLLARLGELPAGVSVKPVPVLLGAILNHWGQRGPAEISAKRLHTYRQSVFLGQTSRGRDAVSATPPVQSAQGPASDGRGECRP
jgi:2-hydroxychromene-2-carboxylate isomerase